MHFFVSRVKKQHFLVAKIVLYNKNMKILIRSRKAIEKMACQPFAEKTAIISVTDWNCEFAKLKNTPAYLLQIDFDDVDNDIFLDELGRKPTEAERIRLENKYHMLSNEQAKQIADFYIAIENEVNVVIFQCEHGQSRSAAIAAAIMEHRSKKGIEVFSNDNYYPNKVVFRKVFNALNKH